MDRQEIVKELERLVRSKNNDAVKLAFLEFKNAAAVGRLDLRGVSEFKRSEKGCFEVKFVDRLKALELLERLCPREDGDGLEEFLAGLQGDEAL